MDVEESALYKLDTSRGQDVAEKEGTASVRKDLVKEKLRGTIFVSSGIILHARRSQKTSRSNRGIIHQDAISWA